MDLIGDAIVSAANLAIVVLALVIYLIKGEIYTFFKKYSPKAKPYLNKFFKRLRVGRISWANVGLSIALLFFLDLTIINLTNTIWVPEEEFITPGFLLSSFLAPIGEEILFRGFIFGTLSLFLIPLALNQFRRINYENNKVYIGFFLVLQALIFAQVHENPHIVSFFIRLLGGLIYGFLYVLNNYNLLPAIITHMAHNLFINSGIYSELGKI